MDLRERPWNGSIGRHPWELARKRFFLGVLEDHGCLGNAHTILDAGSGDAYFAQCLAEEVPELDRIACWDRDYTAESRAKLEITDPRMELVSECPEGRFDLILALDVLEHIDDDRAFLENLVRDHLAPQGNILVSVPAWQALATGHDHRLLHHRRYRPKELERLLVDGGLEIISKGGLFHSLLLPRAIAAAGHRMGGSRVQNDAPDPLNWQHGRFVTAGIYAALRVDNWLSSVAASRAIPLPGLSEWALCRA